MIPRASSSFQRNPQAFQAYEGMDQDMISSSAAASAAPGEETHSQTLMYNLSVLKDKVQQLQSLVSVVVSPGHVQQGSASVAIAGAGSLIEDIIVAASSMLYAFQQAVQNVVAPNDGSVELPQHQMKVTYEGTAQPDTEAVVLQNMQGGSNTDIFVAETHYNNYSNSIEQMIDADNGDDQIDFGMMRASNDDRKCKELSETASCDVIELDAADLLAKYTHYCQVCGKGFKRDANLRMHMRAHGDEYKTNAALANPAKSGGLKDYITSMPPRKYSCPHEGCRWNKKHAKFQPLKSMICVKNHYKRSHCPKMYVCNRCNRKQFSVLSDLRTHEKHCGDLRWQCSCGTTFSRKDKLMGHVALFVGHSPVMNSTGKQVVQDYHLMQMHMDGR